MGGLLGVPEWPGEEKPRTLSCLSDSAKGRCTGERDAADRWASREGARGHAKEKGREE